MYFKALELSTDFSLINYTRVLIINHLVSLSHMPFSVQISMDTGLFYNAGFFYSTVLSNSFLIASSRGGLSFRSKKSQLSTNVGNGSDHLTNPILGGSTAMSSEALTVNCRLGPSELSAPTSTLLNEYASPRSACSEIQEPVCNASRAPKLPPAHALRPTGFPDPSLWYHLEWTGTTTSNGILHSSPQSNSSRKRRTRKSPKSEATNTRCSHRTKCNCLRNAGTNLGRSLSDSDSSRVGVWTSRSRAGRRSPSAAPMDATGTSDSFVRRPLFDKRGENQDSQVSEKAHSSLRIHVIRRRKSPRRKSNQRSLKKGEKSITFDRLMESLPKEVFFNRLVLTRVSLFDAVYTLACCNGHVP